MPKKRHSAYAANRGHDLSHLVPVPVDCGDHLFDGQPRLRLVAQREFIPEVPFRLFDAPKTDAMVHAPVDQLGPVLSQQVPVVTGNDFNSMLAAFNKRCNYHSDSRVSPSVVKDAKRLASQVFPRKLWSRYDWTQDAFESWIAKFNPEKQTRMRSALLNLHDVDFRSLNTKSLMVKGEVLLKRNDPSWAPRVIYVGTDEYNVLTGPIQDEFNNRLANALNLFSNDNVEKVIFAYKTDDVTIANTLSGCERYYEGDFSANDKSQLSDVHEIFAHWLKCSGAPSWYRKFYTHNSKRFTVRSYEYGVEATIENQLATGGTDTTGRNTVWNFSLWYSYCRKRGILHSKAAILGDDIAAGVGSTGLDCDDWTEHCRTAGMGLKARERRFYCDLTFLSKFFVPAGLDNCMVPLIGKALLRFNARANRNSDVSDDQYICGKALSYAYEFRHVPYLRDAYLSRCRSTGVSIEGVRLQDMTWFSRSAGLSAAQVSRAALEEPVTLSEDDFLEVIMAKYDVGFYNMDLLRDRLILSSDKTVFESPDYYAFAHEVE